MKQINKLLVLATILLIAVSCTTQRKRGDMSKMSEIWHNTNAHYNGYFNANEIIMLTELQLAEQHEDNYNKILDTYEYVEVENPQTVAEQLDEAVRKVTVVVNLHPYSQWTDDCYLLAGRALYLKQDYEGAEKAFRYLINEYPPEPKEERSTKAKKGKRSSNKNASSRRSTSSRNNDTTEEQKRPMTAREREKERKRYNREVRKRKKQRARNSNKKRSSSRSTTPKTDETPAPETPQPEPEPTPETPSSEAPAKVRLSDNTDSAMANDSENYFLKHRPAYQEGLLWLGRTLIERDNYNGARRVLNQLSQNSATFTDVRREVAVAQAHLAIKERDYEAAVPALELAIELASKKDRRARYAYILAQIHQKRGSSGAAYAAFEQVLKYRPDYTMEFAARLNLAQNAYLSGKGSAAEAMANLEKMLKDEKNQNFLDQIYYAMAEIALAQNDRVAGIGFLEKSLANSLSNRAQKAEAYIRLGNLFYEDEDYLAAKLYYDSTLTVLSPADERFVSTERLRDNLVEIATHIETIVLQDSLLMIAAMSPEEQADLAKQIKDAQQQATVAATSGSSKFNPGGQTRNAMRSSGGRPSPTPALRSESNFWAYDDRVVKRGEREFTRRWGSRGLEDDWRRSNKRSGSALEDVTDTGGIDLNLLTQDQIDEILADVPKDENQKEAARLAIKQAMFQLGRLYRDRLNNNEKSVAILEELNAKYPGNIHELDSWYYLYIAHKDLGNSSQAKEYFDKIMNKYPTSNYGRVLQDPSYAQEYLDEERQLSRQYDQVYSLFQAGEYQNALGSAQSNLSRIMGKHPLKPKYALLMAMCVGNTQGKEAYIAELQKVVATYPEAPEETRAKEILRLLGGAGAALPGNADEEQGDFKTGDNELHYIIIVFDSDDINLNDNKIKVSDYNRQYHSLDKLRISNVYLGESNDVPVLVLRRFKDKEEAMRYFNGVQANMADFIDPNAVSYNIFPITQSNYREILRNRSVAGYQSFFESAY